MIMYLGALLDGTTVTWFLMVHDRYATRPDLTEEEGARVSEVYVQLM
jgi:hypothetical protein